MRKGRPQHEKGEDPRETSHGSVDQDSPIKHMGEEAGMTEAEAEAEEEEEEETHHPLLEEIEKSETMGQS